MRSNGLPELDRSHEQDAASLGISIRELTTHADERGNFTEIFRDEWSTGVKPLQWNLVTSNRGVLRGVHVHWHHADYLLLARGRMTLGLQDLRVASPTFGNCATLDLDSETPRAVTIPVGIAHGFLFSEPSTHIYGVTEYWDMSDELGCRWDDPNLAIEWPAEPGAVSERDEALDDFSQLMKSLEPHQSKLWPAS